MDGYPASAWGDRVADVYDEWLETMVDVETESAVDLLAELAGRGPVLELAIGTGRIGLPLSERGLEVHGIELSEAMVAKLRARPGGERIPVTVGNFADVGVDGLYSLIFIAMNTIFVLHTQEEQIRCFENVAAHLDDGGHFVIETHVADMSHYERGQAVTVFSAEPDRVMLGFYKRDAATQRVDLVEVWIDEDGIRLFPMRERPVPPSELDLIARLAGLRLRDRWGGWRREPFTASSTNHVSVYERDPAR